MKKANASPVHCESVACWKAGPWWTVEFTRLIWLAGGWVPKWNGSAGIGVWVEDYQAPDHLYLHMGHACGAHTMVEMSFSYNATSREPRTHFQYELIGSDGVIRYNREEHSFELRNSHGTQWLAWHPEKNFAGMHWEFAHALSTGDLRDMPTAKDGLLATRIARLATEEAMRDRERTSQDHPSTMVRAVNTSRQTSQVRSTWKNQTNFRLRLSRLSLNELSNDGFLFDGGARRFIHADFSGGRAGDRQRHLHCDSGRKASGVSARLREENGADCWQLSPGRFWFWRSVS